MYEVFKKYISSKTSITDEQLEWIKSLSQLKKLRKKQYLLQEGDICKNHGFVTKGCTRTYSVDQKGIEHIISFAVENWWVSDRESLLSGNPARFNIDVIEDSEILLISKDNFELICKEIPEFNNLMNNILQKSFLALQNRIHTVISLTAEQKYLGFAEKYPGFVTRIPQSMIASYLGITAETLSRVRKISAKK